MNDASRKRLTDYLEEFLHDYVKMHGCSCGFESDHSLAMYNHIKRNPNRTFTTGNDMLDLKEKIVKKGDWRDFHDYCTQRCDRMFRPHEFENWLFTMPRFAELVDEWLREKEEKP